MTVRTIYNTRTSTSREQSVPTSTSVALLLAVVVVPRIVSFTKKKPRIVIYFFIVFLRNIAQLNGIPRGTKVRSILNMTYTKTSLTLATVVIPLALPPMVGRIPLTTSTQTLSLPSHYHRRSPNDIPPPPPPPLPPRRSPTERQNPHVIALEFLRLKKKLGTHIYLLVLAPEITS